MLDIGPQILVNNAHTVGLMNYGIVFEAITHAKPNAATLVLVYLLQER